jgi:hypothetical protein
MPLFILWRSDMDLKYLYDNLEKLASEVHKAWWKEKEKQGFHSVLDCPDYIDKIDDKFVKICEKCHTDMYPYDELPDNVKEYDRVTVRTVLAAIKNLKNP